MWGSNQPTTATYLSLTFGKNFPEQSHPAHPQLWLQYAELETFVGDVERARDIYKLGVEVPYMDQPDVLWKSYIDFEISQNQLENARELYEKLLQKTKHFKVREKFDFALLAQ